MYRKSAAYRRALIASVIQRARMRYRVGTLENVRAPSVSIRRRQKVRS